MQKTKRFGNILFWLINLILVGGFMVMLSNMSNKTSVTDTPLTEWPVSLATSPLIPSKIATAPSLRLLTSTVKVSATTTPTLSTTEPGLPSIVWDTPPPCEIAPLTVADWYQFATTAENEAEAEQQLTIYMRQVQAMSAVLRNLGKDDLLLMLAEANGTSNIDLARRNVLTLWLNVVSGRLNRATEVTFSTLPEIDSVGTLLARLEESLTSGEVAEALLTASDMLLRNEGISLRVCEHLLYLKADNKIEQSLLTGQGLITHPVSLNYNKVDFNWLMSYMVPAPNYRLIAIETSAYERGGPIYIWDRETGEFFNLNDRLATALTTENKFVFSYGYLGTWQVIGWHPNSEQLLIGQDLTGIVFWVNLQNYTYQQIDLGNKEAGGRLLVDLAPDGSGFVYIQRKTNSNTKIMVAFYDLTNGKVTPIFSPADEDGYPQFPRFSPTGAFISFVTNQKRSPNGIIRSIHLLDLKAHATTILFEDYLRGG